MAQKYIFDMKVLTVDNEERDIDLDVSDFLEEVQEDGWEYVSGPLVESSPETSFISYKFLVKRAKPYKSAYEDHGLTVV